MSTESNYNCLLATSESPTEFHYFRMWHVITLLFAFWRCECLRCGETEELMEALDIHRWRITHAQECPAGMEEF